MTTRGPPSHAVHQLDLARIHPVYAHSAEDGVLLAFYFPDDESVFLKQALDIILLFICNILFENYNHGAMLVTKNKIFNDKTVKYSAHYWDEVFTLLRRAVEEKRGSLPSVSIIAKESGNDPFAVLVSTLISLRTKDEVTLAASRRLLAAAPDISTLADLDTESIEKAIYPAGFYKRKAVQLKELAEKLRTDFRSQVPSTAQELLSLPGVGIKTANLTLNLGFGISAVCVDCHVHQIANRTGWISTKTPEESVSALEAAMPEKYWISLNELLVSFGQTICLSSSPLCSQCPLSDSCQKNGVRTHR